MTRRELPIKADAFSIYVTRDELEQLKNLFLELNCDDEHVQGEKDALNSPDGYSD